MIQQLCNIFPFISFWSHLSSKDMLLLLNHELSLRAGHQAEKHLLTCRSCRARYECLRQAALSVDAYCDALVEGDLPRNPAHRAFFAARLNRLFHEASSSPRLTPKRERAARSAFPPMNPMFATSIVLAIASVACLVTWIHQAQPNITSNTLLVRAEAWDATTTNTAAGVICQRVSIKTSRRELSRKIYRDAHGRRKPKPQRLAGEDNQLKDSLATAGVLWNDPLSATSYQDWHDHQRVRQDRIQKTGKNLMLTTTVPDGDVVSQALTVRESDFHPIERTIVFRNMETVEIAELDYQVLPWTETTAVLFESPEAPATAANARPQPALVLHMPLLPSEKEVDEAELSARLVLNELHGDSGEQIRIDRDARGVQVKGLVETEMRRAELETQLRTIPLVSVAILSIEELRRHPDRSEEVNSQSMGASSPQQPSPLEIYFAAHGRGLTTVSGLSAQLTNSALTIDQESRAITDLVARFGAGEKMTDIASATLSELIFSHRERLFLALQQERNLLNQVEALSNSTASAISVDRTMLLTSASARNLALCKELTFGADPSPRRAESILGDLSASLDQVRASAHETRIHDDNTAANRGRK